MLVTFKSTVESAFHVLFKSLGTHGGFGRFVNYRSFSIMSVLCKLVGYVFAYYVPMKVGHLPELSFIQPIIIVNA